MKTGYWILITHSYIYVLCRSNQWYVPTRGKMSTLWITQCWRRFVLMDSDPLPTTTALLPPAVIEARKMFLIFTTEFIEKRIGERVAKFLGEKFVHTISLHTGPLSNPRVRAVCQGQRQLVLWSRPSPYPLWACWAVYLWWCIQYHN